MNKLKLVAILSTTILPIDGTYTVKTLSLEERESIVKLLMGVPHYVGHPDTKILVESFGSTKANSNLFSGLAIGESALAFPIKQGVSTRKDLGFTEHQNVDLSSLDLRIITRIDLDMLENHLTYYQKISDMYADS